MNEKRFIELASVMDKIKRENLFWCDNEGPCACSGCVNPGRSNSFIKQNIVPPSHEEFLEYMVLRLEQELLKQFARIEKFRSFTNNYSGFKAFISLKEDITRNE